MRQSSRSVEFFHVSPARNLRSINRFGILPSMARQGMRVSWLVSRSKGYLGDQPCPRSPFRDRRRCLPGVRRAYVPDSPSPRGVDFGFRCSALSDRLFPSAGVRGSLTARPARGSPAHGH